MEYAIKKLKEELNVLSRFDNVIRKDPNWKYAIKIKKEKQDIKDALKILINVS